MSKYDFEIDLSLNSSTGMILSKLRPGSVVLEFGCAAGRMTRYMKEEMGCRVYIVEYDQGAFRKAMQFAEDGICDDIQNYRWAEQYAAITFDAIIFADVLEHLTQPEEVLKKAAELLKDDGCVYVSIPNVTHNDILLKLYEERFDYTRTGLLDDTHIHFWGLENMKALGSGAGLAVRSLEGTHCSAGSTEQNVRLGQNLLLENILRTRQAGEVYQFVATLVKGGASEPVCTIAPPAIMSHLYLDTGKDFNPEERIAFASEYSENSSYIAHFELADTADVCRVRLDPVEFQGVVLRSVSICQKGEALHIVAPGAIQTADGIYLPGDDPMVFAQVLPENGPVTVDAEFLLPGVDYLRFMEQTVCKDQEVLAQTIQQSRNDIHGLQEAIVQLNREIAERDQKAVQQQKTILQMQQEYSQLQQENSQLRTDVCAYIILANQKEKVALALEQQLAATEQKRDEYAALAENRGLYIQNLEQHVTYYQNLRVIRLRAFVGRVLRKIKRCVKKLLGRG